MGFNLDKFMNTTFVPRESDVELPDLAPWFPEGEKPVFRVRGLNGNELGKVTEAAAKYKTVAAFLDGIMSGVKREVTDSVRGALGLNDDVPGDTAQRLEALEIGSVEPKFDRPAAVKFCMAYPVEFKQLTQEIFALTGKGHEAISGK